MDSGGRARGHGSSSPDASLRIRPKSGRPTGVDDPDLDVWVHFDAKYRVTEVTAARRTGDGPSRVARRDDLLKMHAYRDAIPQDGWCLRPLSRRRLRGDQP